MTAVHFSAHADCCSSYRSGTINMSRATLVVILVALACSGWAAPQKKSWADKLDEDNWGRMLEGEWMVEFYAPWCPACKSLEPIWESLAFQKKELGINVGKVDVTDAPGLSGRFMVTALPTIYHVKNGVFRQYKSPRDKDSLVQFIQKKTWHLVEPIPSWKSPTSIQMYFVSQFYRMSQVLRGIHNKFMEDFGLPTWGSYLIFAVATIFLGTALGLVIVCIIDFIYPPKKSSDGFVPTGKDKGDYERLAEDVKDDLVDEEGSESEEKSENDKTDKSNASSPSVRKRKARKAD